MDLFIYSFIGWCGEVIVAAVNRHKFVNRGIYRGIALPDLRNGSSGGGGVLPELKENLIFLFIGGMIVTSFVEYITGRLMEKILHKKWVGLFRSEISSGRLHLSAGICFMGRVQCTDDLLPESVFCGLVNMIPRLIGEVILWVLLGLLIADGLGSGIAVLELKRKKRSDRADYGRAAENV